MQIVARVIPVPHFDVRLLCDAWPDSVPCDAPESQVAHGSISRKSAENYGESASVEGVFLAVSSGAEYPDSCISGEQVSGAAVVGEVSDVLGAAGVLRGERTDEKGRIMEAHRDYVRRQDGSLFVRAWKDGDQTLHPVRFTSNLTGCSVIVGEYGDPIEARDVADWLGSCATVDDPVSLSGA